MRGCELLGPIAASLLVTSGSVAAPATRKVVATAGQIFGLAEEMVRRGKSDDAEAILNVLSHDRDPNVRNEARFRRAHILEAKGQLQPAAVLLRRIVEEKPDATPARLELAQLLQQLGNTDAALRELRAAQAAGLPAAVARIVDRYSEAIRASRPTGASIELALAPDSNVNRSTRSDSLGTIFGDFDIDRSSKAKSGVGVSIRALAFRRLALGSSGNSLLARLSGFGDLYGRSDFNDVAVDLAVGPELRIGRNQVNVELGATQRWFGQKPFARSARIGLTWARPLGRRTQLRLNTVGSIVDNQFNDLQDGKTYSGRITLERALSATAGAALNFGADRASSKDPAYSTIGWRAGLLAWKDVGRATFTISAELGRLHADERLLLLPDKRRDLYSRLTLGATFKQLTFKGFAPVSRFTIERNRSTVEFYDYRRMRTELALVNAF